MDNPVQEPMGDFVPFDKIFDLNTPSTHIPNYMYHWGDALPESEPSIPGRVFEQADRVLQSLYPSYEIHLEAARAIYRSLPWNGLTLRDLAIVYIPADNATFSNLLEGKLTITEAINEVRSRRPPGVDLRSDGAVHFITRSLLECVKGSTTHREHGTHFLGLVSHVYLQYGFVWNNYYAFVNPNHPMVLAMNGEISLTPEVFELANGPLSTYNGLQVTAKLQQLPPIPDIDPNQLFDRERYARETQGLKISRHNVPPYKVQAGMYQEYDAGHQNALLGSVLEREVISPIMTNLTEIRRTLVMMDDIRDPAVGWKKGDLIRAITSIVGDRDPREVLNLSLITSNPAHRNIVLPGFDIPFFRGTNPLQFTFIDRDAFIREGNAAKKEMGWYQLTRKQKRRMERPHRPNIYGSLPFDYYFVLFSWHQHLQNDYYRLIYRNLTGSLAYTNIVDLCRFNLPVSTIISIAKNTFNTVISPLSSPESACTQLINENNRRMMIKNGIRANITPDDVFALILQPNSVWIMDAVGTVSMFKDDRGHLSPYPDAILPQTLTELAQQYYEVCRNKDKYSLGVFISIIQKLGHGMSLPANLTTIDKNQLCHLIDTSLRDRLAEEDVHVIRNRLPKAYVLYREMCVNRRSYPLDVFVGAAVELGVEEDAKIRICQWLHSMPNQTPRITAHIDRICGAIAVEQNSLTVIANAAMQYDRSGEVMKEMICKSIMVYLDTVRVSYLKLGQ
jgi:hypothetical protein